MKLHIDGGHSQGDPYVIKHDGKYYMYATAVEGVQLYESNDRLNWHYIGICYNREGRKEYWAPACNDNLDIQQAYPRRNLLPRKILDVFFRHGKRGNRHPHADNERCRLRQTRRQV